MTRRRVRLLFKRPPVSYSHAGWYARRSPNSPPCVPCVFETAQAIWKDRRIVWPNNVLNAQRPNDS